MIRAIFFHIGTWVWALLCGMAIACHQPAAGQPMPVSSQLVVVTSPGATNIAGILQRFEAGQNGSWQPVGHPVSVSLGRSGLAWGKGLHAPQPGQQKKEGDGKSPAGIFELGSLFGYAYPDSTLFKMPYLHASATLECVDDVHSEFYNQLVDNQFVEKKWASSELMRRNDHQYEWGAVVLHNSPAINGYGSCIFLHVWKGNNQPTAGCTAMSRQDLLELLHWLDPSKKPLLVQMTSQDYLALQEKYGLPNL